VGSARPASPRHSWAGSTMDATPAQAGFVGERLLCQASGHTVGAKQFTKAGRFGRIQVAHAPRRIVAHTQPGSETLRVSLRVIASVFGRAARIAPGCWWFRSD
jgi:hypothetical protein